MMSPIKTIKLIPRKSIYKILDIVTYNGLIWQLLDKYKSSNLVRSVYLRELLISVMLCGDIKNGYAVHKCEDCGLEHKVGFSCGKRFCNICGYRRSETWVQRAKSKVLNVGHRHIIVTMPEVLWKIFAYERDLLKLISQTGHKVIQLWGLGKGIVKHGIISMIHTFGYDLKWNPHGHFIVTEGGLTSSNSWRSWPWNKKKHRQPYISFSFLQSKWRELFSQALFSALEQRWDQNPHLRDYIYQQVMKIKKEHYRIEKQKRKKDRHRISFRGQPSRRDLKDLV